MNIYVCMPRICLVYRHIRERHIVFFVAYELGPKKSGDILNITTDIDYWLLCKLRTEDEKKVIINT